MVSPADIIIIERLSKGGRKDYMTNDIYFNQDELRFCLGQYCFIPRARQAAMIEHLVNIGFLERLNSNHFKLLGVEIVKNN